MEKCTYPKYSVAYFGDTHSKHIAEILQTRANFTLEYESFERGKNCISIRPSCLGPLSDEKSATSNAISIKPFADLKRHKMEADPDIIEDEKYVKSVIDGIERAKQTPDSVYNITLGNIQSIEVTTRWVGDTGGDSFVDPGTFVAGSESEWDEVRPAINLLGELGGTLGTFSLLPLQAFREVIFRMPAEDILNLCNSSRTFRARCNRSGIYTFLTKRLFPTHFQEGQDVTAQEFEALWDTRLTVDDIQAGNDLAFVNHPQDVIKIIDQFIIAIDILNEKVEGFTGDRVSTLNAIDALFMLQFPRWRILEQFDFPFHMMALWANFDNGREVEIILGEMLEDGIDFNIPHVADGIPHRDYLRLIQPLAPPNNIRKDPWMRQINRNIVREIYRLQNKASMTESDEIDLNMLLKLFSLERENPFYFWIWHPNVGALQDAIEAGYIRMMDYRAKTLDQVIATERFFRYQEVFNKRNEGGDDIFYNADYDVIYTGENVSNLLASPSISEDDIDDELGIIGDIERFETIWQPKFNLLLISFGGF